MNSFRGMFYDEYGDEDGGEESKIMSDRSRMTNSRREVFDPPTSRNPTISGVSRISNKGYTENDHVKSSPPTNVMPAPYKVPVGEQFGLRINDEDRGMKGVSSAFRDNDPMGPNFEEQMNNGEKGAVRREVKKAMEDVIGKMLISDDKSKLKDPVIDINKRMGYRFQGDAAKYGKDYRGGYQGVPNTSTELRNPDTAADLIEGSDPKLAAIYPHITAEMAKLYGPLLAEAVDTEDDRGLYNPEPANFFTRYAYILKQRRREDSLYGK